jgi:hypothetical protein
MSIHGRLIAQYMLHVFLCSVSDITIVDHASVLLSCKPSSTKYNLLDGYYTTIFHISLYLSVWKLVVRTPSAITRILISKYNFL